MTDSFIQKIKWFVLSWMGNSVSLFTRSKVTAADAVFLMQSGWGEGAFPREPLYKLYKRDGGGGRDRVCDCFPGYQRTFDFFFFSSNIIQKEATPQGAEIEISCRTRKTFFFLGKGKIMWGFGGGNSDFCHWTMLRVKAIAQDSLDSKWIFVCTIT